jgi:16S rRNA G966 N2-methylase RsmD
MATPRIIAGKAKGLRLFAVPGDSTRPITDRVKESLFNILGRDIVGTTFLDLFGGTEPVSAGLLKKTAKPPQPSAAILNMQKCRIRLN